MTIIKRLLYITSVFRENLSGMLYDTRVLYVSSSRIIDIYSNGLFLLLIDVSRIYAVC